MAQQWASHRALTRPDWWWRWFFGKLLVIL